MTYLSDELVGYLRAGLALPENQAVPVTRLSPDRGWARPTPLRRRGVQALAASAALVAVLAGILVSSSHKADAALARIVLEDLKEAEEARQTALVGHGLAYGRVTWREGEPEGGQLHSYIARGEGTVFQRVSAEPAEGGGWTLDRSTREVTFPIDGVYHTAAGGEATGPAGGEPVEPTPGERPGLLPVDYGPAYMEATLGAMLEDMEAVDARYGEEVTLPVMHEDGSEATASFGTIHLDMEKVEEEPDGRGGAVDLVMKVRMTVTRGEAPIPLSARMWFEGPVPDDGAEAFDGVGWVASHLATSGDLLYVSRAVWFESRRDLASGEVNLHEVDLERRAVTDDSPLLSAEWPLVKTGENKPGDRITVGDVRVPEWDAFVTPEVERFWETLAGETLPTIASLEALGMEFPIDPHPKRPRRAEPKEGPVVTAGTVSEAETENTQKLSELSDALGGYVTEHGCFPPEGVSLEEALGPYVRDPSVFDRPEDDAPPGYALNPALRGHRLDELAITNPTVVFESDDGENWAFPHVHPEEQRCIPEDDGAYGRGARLYGGGATFNKWQATHPESVFAGATDARIGPLISPEGAGIIFSGPEAKREARETERRVKLLSQAVLAYAAEHEGRLPAAEIAWEDAVRPYLAEESALLAPGDDALPSFALNPVLRGRTLDDLPSVSWVLLAESDDGEAWAMRHEPGACYSCVQNSEVIFVGWTRRNEAAEAGIPIPDFSEEHLERWREVFESSPVRMTEEEAAASRLRAACDEHLERIADALRMYANDHGGVTPPEGTDWREALLPYVPSEAVFYCPATGEPYAFDPAASGRSLLAPWRRQGIVLVAYDSADGVTPDFRHAPLRGGEKDGPVMTALTLTGGTVWMDRAWYERWRRDAGAAK